MDRTGPGVQGRFPRGSHSRRESGKKKAGVPRQKEGHLHGIWKAAAKLNQGAKSRVTEGTHRTED
jgi:hypothetical protein